MELIPLFLFEIALLILIMFAYDYIKERFFSSNDNQQADDATSSQEGAVIAMNKS